MKPDIRSRTRSPLPLWTAALLGAGLSLSSCGGLGDGVLPVNAVLQPFGGVEGAVTVKAFTCLNTGLSLFVDFSNGARGDFTNRATYSSSNPAVVKVSNLDIAVPEQPETFFNRGTIVPVAPGTATITARYLSFTRNIEVVVRETRNLSITPASADLAVRSVLDLSASAEIDGVTTPLDAAVVWSLVTPNSAVATIASNTGVITGVAPGSGSGLTARARIPGCALTAEAPVSVANLQSLALTREFGNNDKLVVATTERITATGTLDNGRTQDLSSQLTYGTSDTTALSFFTGTLANLALAIRATDAPVQLSATFVPTSITSPSIGIQPVADSLNTIAVTPASAEVLAGRAIPFRAVGNYASGATQDITRHVVWSSSDSTLAAVQTSSTAGLNGIAGLATTANTANGRMVTVTATATNAASQPTSASAILNIR